MAYVSTASHTNVTSPIGIFVAAVKQAIAEYKIYRATLAELDALSDRELSDLGIARCQIQGIALEAAYIK